MGDRATEADYAGVFHHWSSCLYSRVQRFNHEKIPRYAYVDFSQAQDAARAIDVLNFQVVNGKPFHILYCKEIRLFVSPVGNIFIKNLDKDIDTVGLRDTFAQFGNIVSAKVATDGQGNSKGYGFIQFDTGGGEEAIEKVNGMEMNDKVVYVGPFQRRAERGTTETKFNNVFVKNLGEEVTEEELRKVFESHGPVTSVMISKDKTGKSKALVLCASNRRKMRRRRLKSSMASTAKRTRSGLSAERKRRRRGG